MIQTTEAVILKSFPYSDTSLIVKAYTKDFGLQSYILRSARSNKGKTTKAQHFQPLRLVQLELSSNPKARLHNIKSSALMLCCDDTSCNIVKTTLAIFMTEVLNLSIKENTANEELFEFLKRQIDTLEQAENNSLAEFHLHFLLSLGAILGFEPLDNHDSQTPFFDTIGGKFVSTPSNHDTLDSETSFKLHKLLQSHRKASPEKVTSNRNERKDLLEALIRFYAIHITDGRMMKSQDILGIVLS